jgi:small subunit ribosomal protein S6
MILKDYETVFILTPVLSETQMKDTVEKFKSVLKDNGAQLINEENWGLKKLAYPINNKTTGFYHLVEYKGPSTIINTLEIEFKRDERVMRFLTVALDKHAVEYNNKRRKGEFNKKPVEKAEKSDRPAKVKVED